ncbi:hypothetical protein OYT88_08270 [Sporolactobacillus sp. CQH2019]|uniref:hypothetical protein n=1 Tax=Sporolactobacillus sp. CQH2019 TaxID=3023512 RepID=UPI002368C64D|nr:hypothetical protein [Sporolactobacillus sp. CQH2019]MDD9148540.1 hypothetical protein [Sporolactobacillus sp. CQH2019]
MLKRRTETLKERFIGQHGNFIGQRTSFIGRHSNFIGQRTSFIGRCAPKAPDSPPNSAESWQKIHLFHISTAFHFIPINVSRTALLRNNTFSGNNFFI